MGRGCASFLSRLTKMFRNQSGCTLLAAASPSSNRSATSPAFAAPYAIEYLKDATGGFAAGVLAVAFFAFLSAVRVLILGHNPALERQVAPAE
jgi:hypothetical protein